MNVLYGVGPFRGVAMRLHVLSDLHLDYLQNRQRLPEIAQAMREDPADAFILAGDVSHKVPQVEEALRQLADLAPLRMFVAGNHDIWVVKPETGDETDSWRKLALFGDLCRSHGFEYMEDSIVRAQGFTFVGSIGWYDYSYASAALGLPPQEYRTKKFHDLTYMDEAYAKWGMDDSEVVSRLLPDIEMRLRDAEGKAVFVSHHVPLEELVLRRGVASWDFFNAFMGSRRIEAALRAKGVSRFVFGHTHRPVTLTEKGRFVINNPLGYPRQALNPVRRAFVVD